MSKEEEELEAQNNLKKLELFNPHQEDTRRRADSLIRAIFLISGGALTVSISIFTSKSSPELIPALSCILKNSWWLLFISIISLALSLFLMLVRDYHAGENWRKKADFKKRSLYDAAMWLLGIIGMICFIGGLLGLSYVSTSLIS